MSIIEYIGGPVTYEYLMKRSKSDLAHRFLMLLDAAGGRNMDKPTVGRIVHYVQSDNSKWKGEHRPAIISQVWSDTCCNLSVFPGQTEDEQGLITSVTFDENPAPKGRTWHWPERNS